jgi:hypothetical protein
MEILEEAEVARVWPRMLEQIRPHLETYRRALERPVRVVRFRRVNPEPADLEIVSGPGPGFDLAAC